MPGANDYSSSARVCVHSHFRISLVSGALSIFMFKHVSLPASERLPELDWRLDGKV
jgi:hypothetical protein